MIAEFVATLRAPAEFPCGRIHDGRTLGFGGPDSGSYDQDHVDDIMLVHLEDCGTLSLDSAGLRKPADGQW